MPSMVKTIASYLLVANLKEIGEIQDILARQGIEVTFTCIPPTFTPIEESNDESSETQTSG